MLKRTIKREIYHILFNMMPLLSVIGIDSCNFKKELQSDEVIYSL